MLTHLDIHNYTLVDTLNIELTAGLTTLTGETGAGKSLLLDAIGLAIGNRSRGDAILDTKSNAEVCASFDIRQQPKIQQWLAENAIECNETECLLKRVLTPQGRSRCFINGRPAPLSQLQQLGNMLVSIHGQHEHQALLSSSTQRSLLDTYGGHQKKLDAVTHAFNRWHQLKQRLDAMTSQNDAMNAHYELLKYQVDELEQLALAEQEVNELEAQQKEANHASDLQERCVTAIDNLQESDSSIHQALYSTIELLNQAPSRNSAFSEASDLLKTALIHTQEAASTLESWRTASDSNSIDLQALEIRLSQIYTTARKHKVQPEQLFGHHQKLSTELDLLSSGDDAIEELEGQLDIATQEYKKEASALSLQRLKSARKLAKAVNAQLKSLNMEAATLEIVFSDVTEPNKYGNETVSFLITTIPGKPAAPINKVASGGELSRISLAIQVETASKHTTPTLIFDEVDAGIGGSTGDTVGHLLRKLGESTQVMCVTHLAQVASKANSHLKVSKVKSGKSIKSDIQALSDNSVIEEIARMLGGPQGAQTSIEHAKKMITSI